jgi:hypothetical protein
MRKFVMSLVMVLFMAGLVYATEVLVVSANVDKKEVTVKDGDKEATYKYTDSIKVTLVVDKDGNTKDGKLADFERRIKGKGGKGGNKIDITVKDGTITEAKFRAGGKKKQ